MTPKNTVDPDDDDSLGVLDDTASSDMSAIGLLGGTAQVNVVLPSGGEDDDLVDEGVVEGEIVSELVIDTSAVADEDTVARIRQESPEIVIELPAEDLPAAAAESPDEAAVVEAEVVADEAPRGATAEQPAGADPAQPSAPAVKPEAGTEADAAAKPRTPPARKAGTRKAPARKRPAAVAEPGSPASEGAADSAHGAGDAPAAAAAGTAAQPAKVDAPVRPQAVDHDETASRPSERAPADGAGSTAADPVAGPTETGSAPGDDGQKPAAGSVVESSGLSHLESAIAAAKAELREAMSPTRPKPQNEPRPETAGTAEENPPVATDDRAPEARTAAESARPMSETALPTEVVLTSRRLDDLGDGGRESADLLTADRLLDPSRVSRPEPEGTWSHLLYSVSGGRINIGDGRKARARKALSARIATPMPGTARFVPVLSRKGGVGKTTVTALLGMALADARDDRVIAVDANPDRGTLAERVVGGHSKSVRDLVRAQHEIRGFHDISAIVARDETRLDVLASDADPRISEAFGDADYRDVASVAAQYYSLVLTDSGTGIVHSVMGATLDLADQIVIVSGLSVDEARLASETITWLETNGHAALAREAIVVLNQSTPGAPLVRLSELEAHFSTRSQHVLRIPYDAQIAGGGPIDFGSLQPETRRAAREIAAVLVEGLRAKAA
ncbi:MinD/ParA family protein [Microbacterium sp. NPDC058342]|uniref:nucleotide-binding protein n=1 Tax=Microbacterium sp. NPDC058342 TaxID=3346454 RepID=UPI003664A9A9